MKNSYVKLKDVAKLGWGNTSITKSSYVEVGFPAFSAAGSDGYLNHAEFEEDGIVLSAIGARCGKCFKAHGKWTAIKNTITIIPNKEKVDLNYLFTQLNDDKSWKISGAAQPFITLATVRDRLIQLPPLAEQQRIAALLDTVDRILKQRESAIAKLDQLAQSAFVDMFGDVIKNNKGWTLKKLSDVTTKLGSGATPRGGDSEYKSVGISLIRSLNVHDGEFRTKNLAHIDDDQADKLSNVVVSENDILLNITGASVARVCRAPISVLPARVNQHVMIVRPSKSLNAVYLERLLLSAEMKNKLLSVGSSGATREAITKASAENLLIPVPPIEIQRARKY